jgi:hypothetical protein
MEFYHFPALHQHCVRVFRYLIQFLLLISVFFNAFKEKFDLLCFCFDCTYQQIIVIQHVDIVLEVFRSYQLIHYRVLVHKKEFHTIRKENQEK